jgi:hypothetical protein
MLQFDAAPVVTTIPFFVNGEEFYSRGRKLARPYAQLRNRAARHDPVRRFCRGVRLLQPAREAEKHLTTNKGRSARGSWLSLRDWRLAVGSGLVPSIPVFRLLRDCSQRA